MIDFARTPSRQQAIRPSTAEVWIRKLCFCLAQKGDPELKA